MHMIDKRVKMKNVSNEKVRFLSREDCLFYILMIIIRIVNRLIIKRKNNGLNWVAWLHLWLVQHVILSNVFVGSSSGTVHCTFDVEQPRRVIRVVLSICLCIFYRTKKKRLMSISLMIYKIDIHNTL